MNISPREKVLLLILFYILLIGGLMNFVYLPVSDELAEVKQENLRLTRKMESFKQSEEKSAKAVADKHFADIWESRIPQEPEIADFIAFLGETASKSKLSLKRFAYDSKETKNDFVPSVYTGLAEQRKSSNIMEQDDMEQHPAGLSLLSFDVETEGSYYALLDFLNKIQQSPRLLTINYCRLTAANTDIQKIPEAKVWQNWDLTDFQLQLQLYCYCD